MPRICAKYLLGSQLDCPKYPHDILDAPYICRDYYGSIPALFTLVNTNYYEHPVQSLEQVLQALQGLKSGENDGKCIAQNVLEALGAAGPLGYDSFEELCAVDCFHVYQIRLNKMFLKCSVAPFVTTQPPAVDFPPINFPPVSGPELGAPPLPDIDAIGPVQLEMCSELAPLAYNAVCCSVR
jgi:hypothetical protein